MNDVLAVKTILVSTGIVASDNWHSDSEEVNLDAARRFLTVANKAGWFFVDAEEISRIENIARNTGYLEGYTDGREDFAQENGYNDHELGGES